MFGKDRIIDPYNTMGVSPSKPEKSKKKDDGLVVNGVIEGIESLGFATPKIKVQKKGPLITVTGKSPGISVTATYDQSTGKYVVRRQIG